MEKISKFFKKKGLITVIINLFILVFVCLEIFNIPTAILSLYVSNIQEIKVMLKRKD